MLSVLKRILALFQNAVWCHNAVGCHNVFLSPFLSPDCFTPPASGLDKP